MSFFLHFFFLWIFDVNLWFCLIYWLDIDKYKNELEKSKLNESKVNNSIESSETISKLESKLEQLKKQNDTLTLENKNFQENIETRRKNDEVKTWQTINTILLRELN
jgi:hypothetical protein